MTIKKQHTREQREQRDQESQLPCDPTGDGWRQKSNVTLTQHMFSNPEPLWGGLGTPVPRHYRIELLIKQFSLGQNACVHDAEVRLNDDVKIRSKNNTICY